MDRSGDWALRRVVVRSGAADMVAGCCFALVATCDLV